MLSTTLAEGAIVCFFHCVIALIWLLTVHFARLRLLVKSINDLQSAVSALEDDVKQTKAIARRRPRPTLAETSTEEDARLIQEARGLIGEQ